MAGSDFECQNCKCQFKVSQCNICWTTATLDIRTTEQWQKGASILQQNCLSDDLTASETLSPHTGNRQSDIHAHFTQPPRCVEVRKVLNLSPKLSFFIFLNPTISVTLACTNVCNIMNAFQRETILKRLWHLVLFHDSRLFTLPLNVAVWINYKHICLSTWLDDMLYNVVLFKLTQTDSVTSV